MSDRVTIFDTTLRDGEQSPGCSMNTAEKVRMARQLERLGVDVIEARLPDRLRRATSRPSRPIAEAVQGAEVAALVRAARTKDIEARRPGARARAARPRDPHLPRHLGASTSSASSRSRPRRRCARPSRPSRLARTLRRGRRVLGRGRLAHRLRLPDGGAAGGASRPARRTLNVPDTVGYALPDEYAEMVAQAGARHPGRRHLRSTATTTSASPSPTRSPRSRRARARSSARSTASASAPATPRSRRS